MGVQKNPLLNIHDRITRTHRTSPVPAGAARRLAPSGAPPGPAAWLPRLAPASKCVPHVSLMLLMLTNLPRPTRACPPYGPRAVGSAGTQPGRGPAWRRKTRPRHATQTRATVDSRHLVFPLTQISCSSAGALRRGSTSRLGFRALAVLGVGGEAVRVSASAAAWCMRVTSRLYIMRRETRLPGELIRID